MSSDEWTDLVDDLAAERVALEGVLANLPDQTWDKPSPAEGWTLRDCVAHLAESDETASSSALGRAQPDASRNRPDGEHTQDQLTARLQKPAEVLAWYRKANDELLIALRALRGHERLSWVGRSMGVRSFTSARLMEHWSHGLDIRATAQVTPVDTDRLRHVAHLGYITRDFAYRNRGLTPPETTLHIELVAPSGTPWSWGPDDAPDRISGSAGDFCRVVTQRVHLEDTSLKVDGPHAREFLLIAQAFAGPPGTGRPASKS